LTDAYLKENLSEEELIYRFFCNINMFPEKKDYFIKDFEDFYFKVRPKFSSRIIKSLLEGDLGRGILGLFYLISEFEDSFLSACSTLQLLSKLIDFQKNIYAEYFIKELAKFDPKVLRKYQIDNFLYRDEIDGYKQCALNILFAYVDRRRQIALTPTTTNLKEELKTSRSSLLN
jgi:hypothetical protein